MADSAYVSTLGNLHALATELDSARLAHNRMLALYRVGRLHCTADELSVAEVRVNDLAAAVAAAQTHHRETLAGDGRRLLDEVEGALEGVNAIQQVLTRIASDLRSITNGRAST